MKNRVKIRKVFSLFLVLLLIIPLKNPIDVHADTDGKTILETTVSQAGSDCIMLGLYGNFYVDPQVAINRINEIRKDACEDGNIADPRDTTRNLTAEDYVPIQWSAALEKIARIRAVEGGLARELLGSGHNRLNGQTIWFEMEGVRSYGEILAYNYTMGNYVSGINQWYEEKALYLGTREYSGSTGHYVQMINPSNIYIGLGDFYSKSIRYPNTLAGQLTSLNTIQDTSAIATNNTDICQKVEVLKSYIGSYDIKGRSNMAIGEKQTLEAVANVIGTSKTVGNGIDMVIMEELEFTSSNHSIVEVDGTGNVTAIGAGAAEIIVSLNDEELCKMTITVMQPEIPSASPTVTPSISVTPSTAPSISTSPSATATAIPSAEATPSSSASAEATPSSSPSAEATPSSSPNAEATASASPSATASANPSVTPSASSSATPSSSPSATASASNSATPSSSPATGASPAVTPSPNLPIENEEEYHIAARGKIDVGALIREQLDNPYLKISKFTSSDKKIATVSGKGIVTGKADGTVTITAYTKASGSYMEVASVKIKVNKPVFKITEDITYLGCEMNLSEYIQNLPEEVPVSWSIPTSRLSTTEFDSETGLITPYKAGSIKITCIIGEGKYAAKYTSILRVKLPKLKEFVTVKLNRSKTVSVTNLSSYTDIYWDELDSASRKVIAVTDTSRRNVKKITGLSSGTAQLTAIIDGVPYTVIITVP